MERVVLFPGQGAQAVGMAEDFHRSSPAARAVFERAEAVLGIPLRKICFEGPEEALEATDVCQPAILTTSAAIVAALEERGSLSRGSVGAVAGLSLGEYTALWFAGVLDLEDAVRLVRIRGQGMQEASTRVPSGMCSLIGATEESAEELCAKSAEGEVLVVANFLSPGNLVISGARSALERASERAKDCGIRRVIPLKVAGAFHSALMQPAVDRLSEALGGMNLREPSLPVVSNVTGTFHGSLDELRRDLLKQVTSPVRWETGMRTLLERGARRFLEPGPGTVLAGLLRKIDKDASCEGVATWSQLEALGQGGETKEAGR